MSRKDEFLMLLQSWDGRSGVGGWYMSEKLDGMLAMWDGGITRGLVKRDVGWANLGDVRKRGQICTGLWSRLGNVIHAPDWWLDLLPKYSLVGELWCPGMLRQDIMSVVKREIGGAGWKDIGFWVTETLPWREFNRKRTVGWGNISGTGAGWHDAWKGSWYSFRDSYGWLVRELGVPHLEGSGVRLVPQTMLPLGHDLAIEEVEKLMVEVRDRGGEGLVLRNPDRYYECRRVDGVLKYKVENTGSDIVVGVTAGLGRHTGRIGALVLSSGLKLSGMTDLERDVGAEGWVGVRVEYTYRDTTAAGVPVEARYVRRLPQ